MAFNGSGTFNLPSGNPISGVSNSSVHNTTNAEIAAALSNCVTRDGQSPATANIPLGGFKITGLAAGASPGDALRYEQGAKLGGDTFTGLVNLAAGADIASGATLNLTAATGNCPRITGTTATSAVTMNIGQQMTVVADGAWPLTYHATTNKLSTGANYTCTAGDVINYHKDLSGVVHGVISPRPTGVAAGNVLQSDQSTTTVSSASSVALAGTNQQSITGTTAITAFTGTAGLAHHCKAVAALPLTHSAGLAVLQTGASITLDAGATFDVYMLTATTCEIRNIQLASGKAIIVDVNVSTAGPVATTSGVFVDFTSIPAGVRRITIMLNSIGTNGTSVPIIQIGDSGGIEASGYAGGASDYVAFAAQTTGFAVARSWAATFGSYGAITLQLMDQSTNTWVAAGTVSDTIGAVVFSTAGLKVLSATLDRVRLTTVGGTDVFDTGSISITYEV